MGRFDLVVVYVISGSFSACFKIGMMDHLCNDSVTTPSIPTPEIKQCQGPRKISLIIQITFYFHVCSHDIACEM